MSFKPYIEEPVTSIVNNKSDVSVPSPINKPADSSVISTPDDQKPQDICIAKGCKNNTISHPEWDNEYCSISCCYNHCKTTFGEWLEANKSMKMKSNTVPITHSTTSDLQNQ